MQIIPILLALLSLSLADAKPKIPKDAILLSNVKSLTLRSNAKTSHRRVSAIPQLSCKGPGCKHHTIETMRCVNSGMQYHDEDVQWSCSADIPEDFKLGGTEVICEGYASPDDDFVLKGSCGVEYRLLLSDKGEEKYGSSWFSKPKKAGSSPSPSSQDEGLGVSQWLFVFLFIAVLVWILYKLGEGIANQPRQAGRRPRGNNFGGWGGGGGGGDDPPPYDPPPYDSPRYKPSGSSQNAGWTPGFWSGTAAGAAAGYLAGNRGSRTDTPPAPRSTGWFGSGGGSGSGSSWNSGPSRPSNSRSSGSGSGSTTTYESTGFGGTSRR